MQSQSMNLFARLAFVAVNLIPSVETVQQKCKPAFCPFSLEEKWPKTTCEIVSHESRSTAPGRTFRSAGDGESSRACACAPKCNPYA